MSNDYVSICIPAYNAEMTIAATLQSILNQTHKNLEIIIVDNASTDRTLNIVETLKDPRIKIYKNQNNIGAERNWGRCLELASGDFIAVFHADDVYMPKMVEKQVKTFIDNPAIGATFTIAERIDESGKVIGHWKLPSKLKGKRIYHLNEVFPAILRNGNFFMCPSAMVRGNIYKQLASSDFVRFSSSADLYLWLKILEKYPVAIIEEELMQYRTSTSQRSHSEMYLRTDEADFFKVVDHYLSAKLNIREVTQSELDKYELQRSLNGITRSINHIVKLQPKQASMLLKQYASARSFRTAMSHMNEPEDMAYLIFGRILLGLIYLGLAPVLSKRLHRVYSTAQTIIRVTRQH